MKRRWVKLLEKFEEINKKRRSIGWIAAIAQALSSIKEMFFYTTRTVLFVRPLSLSLKDVSVDPEVVVKELQEQDLAFFETVVERSDLEWYKALLSRGRTCFIAVKDNHLAAYMWLATEIDPHLERVYVPLEPGDVYVVEIKTIPDFRRQGFQKVLLKYALSWAEAQGYRRMVSMTGVDNAASLNLHDKLGYQRVSHMTRTKVFFLLNVRYDPNPFNKAGNVWMLY